MKVFAIADTHGNLDSLAGLYEQEEAWNADLVIHLGDLMNCVGESEMDDLRCATFARRFDVLIPGNHETPYFGCSPFYGFKAYPSVGARIDEFREADKYRAAFAYKGWLLTHAGVARCWENEFCYTSDAYPEVEPHTPMSAEVAALKINSEWFQNSAAPLFDSIGRSRGGWAEQGGIFWSDWQEAKARQFNQLFGHSIGDDIRRRKHPSHGSEAVCIDLGSKALGARLAGAWIDDDGELEVVTYGS